MFPAPIRSFKDSVRADMAIYSTAFDLCSRLAANVLEVTGYKQNVNRATLFNESLFDCIESSEEMFNSFLDKNQAIMEIDRLNELKSERMDYFAYGSNLDPERIRSRAPSAVFKGVARLNGYTLKFRIPDLPIKEAFATIEQSTSLNDYVLGVVYSISKLEKQKIEFFEGVSDKAYKPIDVPIVYLDNDNFSTVLTYALSEYLAEGRPTREYLETIRRGFVNILECKTYDSILKQQIREYLLKTFQIA